MKKPTSGATRSERKENEMLEQFDIEIKVNAVISVTIKAESLEEAISKAKELHDSNKLWDWGKGVEYQDGTEEIITVRKSDGWDNIL